MKYSHLAVQTRSAETPSRQNTFALMSWGAHRRENGPGSWARVSVANQLDWRLFRVTHTHSHNIGSNSTLAKLSSVRGFVPSASPVMVRITEAGPWWSLSFSIYYSDHCCLSLANGQLMGKSPIRCVEISILNLRVFH